MSEARKLVDLAVYYCMLVSWALLLYILYAVCCRLFYAMDTAIYCQGHCCFIYCMLCTATCVVPRVATLALCQGDCCLIYVLYAMYVYTAIDTTVCTKDTAASHIVCCVLVHVCTMAPGASYVYCKLYTATCFVPWILLFHMYIVGCVLLHSLCHCHCYILYILYVLYCNMFCAKDTAAPYFKFCHGHCLTLFYGCCCFICTYIACSRYVRCMLCTGMFRLLVSVLYISYTVYCYVL